MSLNSHHKKDFAAVSSENPQETQSLRLAFWGFVLTGLFYFVLAGLLTSCSGSIFGKPLGGGHVPPPAQGPSAPPPQANLRPLTPPRQPKVSNPQPDVEVIDSNGELDERPRETQQNPRTSSRAPIDTTLNVANLGIYKALFPTETRRLLQEFSNESEEALSQSLSLEIIIKMKKSKEIMVIFNVFALQKSKQVIVAQTSEKFTLITDKINGDTRSFFIKGTLQNQEPTNVVALSLIFNHSRLDPKSRLIQYENEDPLKKFPLDSRSQVSVSLE